MIASRSSFAGFLNFSCEYSAMYCTESEPNWSPVACGLNVYWRFRPSKTLEEIAVVIQRYGVGARVDAGEDVHLVDVQQPLGLVDRDLGLGLSVPVDLDDLVLAEHPALLVDVVDHHLGAPPAVERPARGERTGVIKEHTDLDRLSLGIGGAIRRGDQEGHADEDQRRNHSQCLHVAGPPRGKGWRGQKPSQ